MTDTWSVEVRRTATGAPLVHMPFTSLMFSDGLNDVGGGSVKFDLDQTLVGAPAAEDLWNEILNRPNVWVIKRNEQIITAFTADSVDATYASVEGTREVTVSGKGLLAVLEHASVLPPNAVFSEPYPDWANDGFYWSFGLDEYQYNGGESLMIGEVDVPSGASVSVYVEDDVFNGDAYYPVEVEDTDSLFHTVQAIRLTEEEVRIVNDGESFTAAHEGTIRGLRVTTFHHFYNLLASVQARFALDGTASPSVLSEIKPGFTRFVDSKDSEWLQRVPEGVNQEPGETLLSVLEGAATGWQEGEESSSGSQDVCDYRVEFVDGFPTLLVARRLGQDRTGQVTFHENVTFSVQRRAERADIKNVVAVVADGGTYPRSVVVATSPSSRQDWGRREVMLTTQGDEDKAIPAAKKLRAYSTELSSWTVSVPPSVVVERADGTEVEINRVYDDYGVGDWIGVAVEFGGVRSVVPLRVAAISGSVDAQGNFSVELTLDSIISLLRELADRTR